MKHFDASLNGPGWSVLGREDYEAIRQHRAS
jgi:hypothetical protein